MSGNHFPRSVKAASCSESVNNPDGFAFIKGFGLRRSRTKCDGAGNGN